MSKMVITREEAISRADAILQVRTDRDFCTGVRALRDAVCATNSMRIDQIPDIAEGLVAAAENDEIRQGIAICARTYGVTASMMGRHIAFDAEAPVGRLIEGRYRVIDSVGRTHEVEDVSTGQRCAYEEGTGGGLRRGYHLRGDGYLVDSQGRHEPGWRM